MNLTPEDFYEPVNFQVAYLNQMPHKKQIEAFKKRYSEMVEDDKEKIAAYKQKLSEMFDDDSSVDED